LASIGSESDSTTNALGSEGNDLVTREPSPLRRSLGRYQAPLLGFAGLASFLAVWSGVSSVGLLPAYILPGPYSVAVSMHQLFTSGDIFPHILFSVEEFLLGYSLAAASGIAVGLLMGWYKKVNDFLDLLVSALYSTPRVAFVSLFIMMFGVIGIWKTAATVFVMVFFPVLMNTLAGVKLCEESYVRVGRALEATDSQLISSVVIPGSIPSIIAGLRIGTSLGLTAIVVGDLYGAQAGLGYLLFLYSNAYRSSDTMAVILLFAMAGIIVNLVLRRVEQHYSAWKPSIA